jgi:acyl-CoA synthetase (AMP-forming)/AMP-acid ligase II
MLAVETAIAANRNIARFLPDMARRHPQRPAVVDATGAVARNTVLPAQLSFTELNQASDRYAWGLTAYGIRRGTRVLLMVPAGLPLICLTFALFKAGCVPILIDPAMGRRNLLQCIGDVEPTAMIGIERAHLARRLFPQPFRSLTHAVTVGRRLFWDGVTLDQLNPELHSVFPLEDMRDNDPAAIIFTTGSTGLPKGVLYEHGMFNAQVEILRELYGIAPGEIDMPAFPLFALFNAALGTTSVIPPIDPTRPAGCDPAAVVETVGTHRITTTFGSPAIWDRVTAHCMEQNLTLPTLQRVLMAGAPVPRYIHERFRRILEPGADTHTPYGATEALPIASISGSELLGLPNADDPTAGTCVGRPVPGVTLRIIAISDEAIPDWPQAEVLPPYQVGEIAVKGPAVTKTYVNREKSTRLAKIREGEATWHRMGDLAYIDDDGRVWFYGRKGHRVVARDTTLFTEPCELIFNQHPDVFRSALVGVPPEALNLPASDGPQVPVMVIEPHVDKFPRNARARAEFAAALLAIGGRYAATKPIGVVLFHPAFPVDIRHNAKIFREKLAVWADRELRRRQE